MKYIEAFLIILLVIAITFPFIIVYNILQICIELVCVLYSFALDDYDYCPHMITSTQKEYYDRIRRTYLRVLG